MNTMLLNGESYTFGDDILTIGLDMNCDKVITKCKLFKTEDGYHIEEDGINVIISESDLKDFYVYSKRNLNKLKEMC